MTTRDVGISLPRGWRRTSDPGRGVLVTARAATAPPSGVHPRVTLTWRPPGDGPAEVAERDLEDEDAFDLAGREVTYRRYARLEGGVDVLCDEWSWHSDEASVVLTGRVAREDYPDYCDVFEAIAETFDPPLP
ncbi:hypothetical protein H5V45_13520 [Nocardioides sp. KIGAM211]|uniref:Uncharacterized protein n=1 Tax=Nocardioides luti TaxID=2761101 RepID=A0A7X0RJB8_9ACTN|nr:hypothetical protein [Nocardioides luti]MBB6628340.1 hypothetical protein [Nocardioides luti]